MQRALFVCSTYSLLDDELNKSRHYCHLNGYPCGSVDTLIGIGLTEHLNRNNNNESDWPVAGCEKQRLFVEVPYIGNYTESTTKNIQYLTGSVRPDLDVFDQLRNNNINSIDHVKSIIDRQQTRSSRNTRTRTSLAIATIFSNTKPVSNIGQHCDQYKQSSIETPCDDRTNEERR